MRLLVDENVDVRVLRLLSRLGHDSRRVPAGLKNGAVMRLAIRENRVLLTRDSDFTDQTRYPLSRSPGIIHLDIHPPSFDRLAAALRSFLEPFSGETLSGRLFVLAESGFAEFQ